MSVTRHVDPTYTWPVAHKGASKAKQGSRCRGQSRVFFFPPSPRWHTGRSAVCLSVRPLSPQIYHLYLSFISVSLLSFISLIYCSFISSPWVWVLKYISFIFGFLSNLLRLFLVISRWDFPSLSYISPLSIPNLSFTYPLSLIHLSHGSVCSNGFLNYFPFSLFFSRRME